MAGLLCDVEGTEVDPEPGGDTEKGEAGFIITKTYRGCLAFVTFYRRC